MTKSTKGKTYEEIYGPEKAAELKELRRKARSFQSFYDRAKGSTYEKIYGLEKAQAMREIRSGENHWMWNPNKEYFRGEDWPEARKAALDRDNNICQDCGKSKKIMDVHHLIPWNKTHNNNLENLISLCRSCHGRREHPNGVIYEITEEIRNKFSQRSIIFWSNPENKRKASERMTGNKLSPKLPHGPDGRFITKDK